MSTLTPLDIMTIAQAEAYRRDALDHAPLEGGWDEGGLASYLWYLDRVVARLTAGEPLSSGSPASTLSAQPAADVHQSS